MRYKTIQLTVAAALLLSLIRPVSAGAPGGLRVHLLRSVRVTGKEIRLGVLGIVRGSDATMVAKVSGIAMGRAPWSKESMVIDRRTVVSRLVSSGVSIKDVRLTGADKITVTRNEKVFEARKLVQIAETFIKKAHPAPAQCQWRLLRNPDDLLAPESDDIELKPRMGARLSGGCVYVEVAAFSGGREIGVAKVLFKQLYSRRKLVALRNIPSGAVLTDKNTKVTVVSVSGKPPAWTSPYGMICAQAVRAGSVIPPSLWRTQKPVIVVKRNKAVRMKIQMTGFMIVATGQALSDGRIGDLIKVRNADSKRIIMARVGADGTVTPVYNNKR